MHVAGAAVLAKTIGGNGWPSHPDLCASERYLLYECLKTFAHEMQTALGMLSPHAETFSTQGNQRLSTEDTKTTTTTSNAKETYAQSAKTSYHQKIRQQDISQQIKKDINDEWTKVEKKKGSSSKKKPSNDETVHNATNQYQPLAEQDDEDTESETNSTTAEGNKVSSNRNKKGDSKIETCDANEISIETVERATREFCKQKDREMKGISQKDIELNKKVDDNAQELGIINEREVAIKEQLMCHQNAKIEEVSAKLEDALEDIRLQEELDYNGDEEALGLYEKIDAMEYQNALNLARLEEHVLKEEEWMNKMRACEEKERILLSKCEELQQGILTKKVGKKVEVPKKVHKPKKERDSAADFSEIWKKSCEERSRKHARHRQKKV